MVKLISNPFLVKVSLDCEFEKNSLSVDDMIMAVDNKRGEI